MFEPNLDLLGRLPSLGHERGHESPLHFPSLGLWGTGRKQADQTRVFSSLGRFAAQSPSRSRSRHCGVGDERPRTPDPLSSRSVCDTNPARCTNGFSGFGSPKRGWNVANLGTVIQENPPPKWERNLVVSVPGGFGCAGIHGRHRDRGRTGGRYQRDRRG